MTNKINHVELTDVLKNAGCEVIGIAAIFAYGFPDATEKIKSKGLSLETLTDFETLCNVAKEQGSFKEREIENILEFAKSRETWQNNAEILAEQKTRSEIISAS